MKILLLADIHSNWPALKAICDRETFDACLVLGDLVDYGSDPVACVDWVRQRATAVIRGNHDHAVAQRVAARTGTGFRELAAATRPLHWQLLDRRRLTYLGQLPVTQVLPLNDRSFLLVHATPRDPLGEYLMNDPEGWRDRLQGVSTDFVCVGHTHVQFHLQVDGVQVINPGSVGQPRDGDSRSAYAVIENGRVELRRIEYDIDATLQHMRDVGVPPRAVDMTEVVLRTGGSLPAGDEIGRGNGASGSPSGQVRA